MYWGNRFDFKIFWGGGFSVGMGGFQKKVSHLDGEHRYQFENTPNLNKQLVPDEVHQYIYRHHAASAYEERTKCIRCWDLKPLGSKTTDTRGSSRAR